jgi:hypothetical protein
MEVESFLQKNFIFHYKKRALPEAPFFVFEKEIFQENLQRTAGWAIEIDFLFSWH